MGVTMVRTITWFPTKADISVKWISKADDPTCGMNTTSTLYGDYHYGLRQMTLTGNFTDLGHKPVASSTDLEPFFVTPTLDLGHLSVTCELEGPKHSRLRCQMPLNPAVLCEEVVLQRS